MKRLMAMLLAVAMLAALLCGCASEGNKETQQTQQPQETEVAAEENVTEAQKPATATETPREIVETLVGDLLDLSAYEVDEDEDSISYYYYDQHGSFPYEITISELNLQLNGVTTYQDLLDAGWYSNMPETADGSCALINTLVGPEGQRITITLGNVNDEEIAIGETYLLGVTGEVKNCGGFTIGDLTENSTISDVINAIGTPYYLYYSEYVGLTVKFEDSCRAQNSITFTFNQDGIVTEISVLYNHYNLD